MRVSRLLPERNGTICGVGGDKFPSHSLALCDADRDFSYKNCSRRSPLAPPRTPSLGVYGWVLGLMPEVEPAVGIVIGR